MAIDWKSAGLGMAAGYTAVGEVNLVELTELLISVDWEIALPLLTEGHQAFSSVTSTATIGPIS